MTNKFNTEQSKMTIKLLKTTTYKHKKDFIDSS